MLLNNVADHEKIRCRLYYQYLWVVLRSYTRELQLMKL